MRMSESLKTITSKVGRLLAEYPELRDSDKLLWLAYLNIEHDLVKYLGPLSYGTLKSIVMDPNTPTMESIRRIRQKYQEAGLYVGRKRQERIDESERVKHWARH